MPIKKRDEPLQEVLPDEEDAPELFGGVPGDDDEAAGIGHNGGPELDEEPPPVKKPVKKKAEPDPQVEARKTLVSFHDRISRLEDERKEIADQIKEVYAEAKGAGFDTKALRAAIAAMKKDREERTEFEDLRDFYIEVLEERV